MGTKHLFNKEAIDKLRDLATSIDFAMMATDFNSKPLHIIPMSTKKVDELGNVWFLSGKDSTHNTNIRTKGDAQLVYSNPGDLEFLTVYGKASIHTDRNILEDLYGTTDDNWFDGVDDPNLSAIKIVPDEVYYWDTKYNKFVSAVEMGIGAITGNEPDVSEEGNIEI